MGELVGAIAEGVAHVLAKQAKRKVREAEEMKMNNTGNGTSTNQSGLTALICVLLLMLAGGVALLAVRNGSTPLYLLAGAIVLVAALVPMSMKIANPWERAIVLRLGRYVGTQGNGVFFIVPFIDEVATWIDTRTQTTSFDAEQALSKDKVPVNVDAVIFWSVHNAEQAALEVVDYRQAIKQVAQTTLREMIGCSVLEQLLSDRRASDQQLKETISEKTQEWGLSVLSVEIRDVGVPQALQDSLSRQAQADAERKARVLLGEAEKEVAQKFVEAADIYASTPAAMQLRAMNIIYETTKERGATILMPTSMVDSMNPLTAASLALHGAGPAASSASGQ
jgi:regulator of protease activity HflC (stomatin/prohibitin superfamily)